MPADTSSVPAPTDSDQLGRLRRVAFYAVVVALLGLMGVFLGDTLVFLVTAWFVSDPGVHHLHDLALVAILWTVIVGLIAQLHHPERRVAAIQQAFLVTVAFTGANVLTGFVFPPAFLLGGLLVAAVGLHPAGWGVLRTRTDVGVSSRLIGLVAIAAIPLTAFIADQLLLHASGDAHAQLGHYADMITYSVLILVVGLLAGLRPVGWRIPLWTAAALAGVFGIASMMHPTLASSAGLVWGGLATIWGIGFVLAGETSVRRHPER